MPQQNELRVFISSTFRDLQEEREHLVKKIFPEIRALCRQRGITFTEVDLRWGLTEEDVGLGRVIRTCLEEVDKCRPYFIGITGDRYGFVPTYLDIQKDPQLLEQYPWIEEVSVDGMSITEMEAYYAFLGVGQHDIDRAPAEKSKFYFRRHRESFEESAESEEMRLLEGYQERIRTSGATIEQFRDPVSLGEMVFDDLATIIKRDFADATPPTPLEQERARHESFSLSRRRAYIANPAYLKRLNDHAVSQNPPLVVYAESGSGKSALFAYWAEQYRRKHPEAHVIEHYVGIGATATDHYGVIRHICMEINERFGRAEEIPSEPAKLETALGQWLGYADYELQKSGQKMVLILDGLNQLQGTALGLKWMPDVIAPSIRLILSSTVEGTLVELRRRGWDQFGMQALSEAERETIVVRYLAEYRKSLNPEQIRRIASDYKCGHPLFLKTVLEELRLVGRHEELDAKIESYLSSTGTEDLFQRVLERLEEDYNMRAVRDTMMLLSASRSGLDERELSEISGLARLKIATMMAGLDYHLVRKEGRLTFFHDYLRRAVEKRYLGDEQTQRRTHVRLAEYFERSELNQRNASERAWQYAQAGDEVKLVATLGNLEVLRLLYSGEINEEVLTQWARLRVAGHDPVTIYQTSLEGIADADVSEQMQSLKSVALVLRPLGLWSSTIEIYRRLRMLATEGGFKAEQARAEASLGGVLNLLGEKAEAMEYLEHAMQLYEEMGDHSGVSKAIGIMGGVYADRGEYERALECYQRQLTISEELGNRRGVAVALGNMFIVYSNRGEYERALECHQRALAISEELGDRRDISLAIGNMGNVYFNRGEYDRALENYQRHLAIAEELGDRYGVSLAIGNMGNVYSNRGEYERALECYQRQLTICEELGNRHGSSFAIRNMGNVYFNRGEYERALECYQQQLTICEELGERRGVSEAIGDIGGVYADRGEYERALECYQRQLAIDEELGDRSGVWRAIGNMGTVYREREEYDRALECFESALREHREIGFRFGVTYWLAGRVAVLIECIGMQSMPHYLPNYIAGATIDTWRILTLRAAREDAEECQTISEDISKTDTLLDSAVLLARLDAAEGNHAGAVGRLHAMLDADDGDQQRAELHYWLWKLVGGDDRTEALRLYQTLAEKTPNYEYSKRIEELQAPATTPEVGDATE